MFWNVNILNPSKLAVISNSILPGVDVLGLAEVGREAPPDLPGFTVLLGKPRPHRSPLGPGRGQGIAAYVRNKWIPYCSVHKKGDYVLWLRFDVPARGVFFLGIVYIPPISSAAEWGNNDGWLNAFEYLEYDIKRYQTEGVVAICGDFNAHTGTWDDTGLASQQVLDAMGVMAGDTSADQVQAAQLPQRSNSDGRAVCEYGQCLVNMCVATQCVILNGRTPGDQQGCITRPSTSSGTAGSLLDYCIVSRALFPAVSNFGVLNTAAYMGVSDHLPLSCILQLPPVDASYTCCLQGVRDREVASRNVECIRWTFEKRERYDMLLRSSHCQSRRAAIISAVQAGTLSPTDACEQ